MTTTLLTMVTTLSKIEINSITSQPAKTKISPLADTHYKLSTKYLKKSYYCRITAIVTKKVYNVASHHKNNNNNYNHFTADLCYPAAAVENR